jgi:hypothetical protein
MHSILPFLSGSCSKTEVFEQPYYEKVTQIDILPGETGGTNGVYHDSEKNCGEVRFPLP